MIKKVKFYKHSSLIFITNKLQHLLCLSQKFTTKALQTQKLPKPTTPTTSTSSYSKVSKTENFKQQNFKKRH